MISSCDKHRLLDHCNYGALFLMDCVAFTGKSLYSMGISVRRNGTADES